MMKVLVVGAHGQIGKIIVDKLHESDKHSVRAMVRKPEQANALDMNGVEACLTDLEGPIEAIQNALEGMDAVIFSAGSGGKTGYDKTMSIDLDGAVKVMDAAKEVGVNRFIIVSAMNSDDRAAWDNEEMKPYNIAKYYADRCLKQSGLTYTILRPGLLKNDPATGKIEVAENLPGGAISREDVAEVAVASLDNETTFSKEFDLLNGDSPIDEALKNL
ncbi:MAG: hypothetical protein PWR19_965 [Carnobacterium sp.]|uniref:SDR family oxidoreductase n=1 Tax=Carnobacterium TaxID=2747 RepID=UPI002647FB78|nr:SDR family oxidoreductase [Carnobacterium sp.]MDN5371919.1 hypothetical protein [Carnobacterium sp.]